METQVNTMSAIDRALAAAKARKAVRDSMPTTDGSPPVEVRIPARSDEERSAAALQRQAEREARQARKAEADVLKAAAKEAKKAERATAKESRQTDSGKPTHMKKVDRARSKCPELNEEAQKIFGEVTANFSAQQIDALAQHLLVHNRATLTLRALSTPRLPLGATVRVTSGNPRYIGCVGTVVKSQNLRATIQVPGQQKLVYIYTGEAEVVEEVAATG